MTDSSVTIRGENNTKVRCVPGFAADHGQIRVALICDFLEEGWPSMDLIGDMMSAQLRASRSEVTVTQMRPALRLRLSQMPLVPGRLAANADRLINRFVDYPLWLRKRSVPFDIFHLIDHSYSQLLRRLPENRTVVTCHDLDTFRCVIEPNREKRPLWFRVIVRRILKDFQRAAHVLAVSSATRNELLEHRLFPPERITVVPNGVHPSCSPEPSRAADEMAAQLLSGDSDTVWLLNVGSTAQRKRLDVLLRVFAAVREEFPQARLVRAGGSLPPALIQLATELKIRDAIVVLPFLEREILAAVYRRSTVLLHTAEAEGFGLPLIEAMACGCPVVASDLPVLREVGADSAVYCSMGDVDHWKETVAGLLHERADQPDAWELRRRTGVRHSGRFSWAENARMTVDIYRKILGRS